MQNAVFHARLNCKNAVFGPFSHFETLECDDVVFSGAQFLQLPNSMGTLTFQT